MRAPGVVGLIQLAAVLAIALPLALFGGSWLLDGRLVYGGAFVGLAALMLLLQWRLTNPLDPVDIAEGAVERLTGDGEKK